MNQPLPRFYAHITHIQDQQKLNQTLQETTPTETPTTVTKATLPGDTRRLRGIPVAGGACGTSPGTDPAHETIRRNTPRH